jgi:hypothetical protein
MPEYSFCEFKRCCNENPERVQILYEPERDAKLHFGLKSKTAIKNFIANDGLEDEDLIFQNSKEWEKNPDKSFKIFVDAYEFRSRYKRGYIAFMYNPKTGYWIIKSFKLSKNNNFALANALSRAGMIGDV